MSLTCGFYNSIAGDRKYNSSQMSRLFDGIIKDGIFMSIGEAFVVTAGSGNIVNVGSGKAWFNHTWTENDELLPIDCGESSPYRQRIDILALKIDSSDAVRNNTLEIIQGPLSSQLGSEPPKPSVPEPTEYVHYYPLCYIYREGGSTEITQADITDVRGIETPWVTGVLETLDNEQLLLQWRAELDEFVASEEQSLDEKYSELQAFMDAVIVESSVWNENQRNTILAWFEGIQDLLDSNTAIKLETHINKSDVERMFTVGLADGEKTFSEDGTTITTVDSIGRRLVKKFTSDFSSCTVTLYGVEGGELGRLIKNFSSDGSTISSELTIF